MFSRSLPLAAVILFFAFISFSLASKVTPRGIPDGVVPTAAAETFRVFLPSFSPRPRYDGSAASDAPGAIPFTGSGDGSVFLPLLVKEPEIGSAERAGGGRRVNAPYHTGDIRYPEAAILWFGQVNSSDNFANVRVAYNDSFLYVNLAVFDRWLWYNPKPVSGAFSEWDSASLYLDVSGHGGDTPAQGIYRFDSMLNWSEPRTAFQEAYRGSSGSWQKSSIQFETTTGWRGNAPNSNTGDDRGWVATFRIPYTSLGLPGRPEEGAVWKLGLALYDRDDSGTPALTAKTWPESLDGQKPGSWGELRFGIPTFTAPQIRETGRVTIRHKLNGAVVEGAAVGGGTNCGARLSYWNDWGNTPSIGSEANSVFNIQNQSDIADWPCFSRYYLNFPLDSLPPGKVILSAHLTLHQSGNSGGGDWGQPDPSYIQIFTVDKNWKAQNLTWNNAPLALENVSAAWVEPVVDFPGWPGIPWVWDVSKAVSQAYNIGDPLSITLYSGDSKYHSGKYFISSYTGDWNANARPSLMVTFGER